MCSSFLAHPELFLSLVASWASPMDLPTPMLPDAHKWEIAEVFSTPDGLIQFIEWFNTEDEEHLVTHETVTTASGNTFNFASNLPSLNTANRRFLIATAGFAALPGAPTPDFIMPANFINPAGDTIFYTGGDEVGFGALPSDGMTSINRSGSQQTNSPQNFAGDSGSINAASITASFSTFGTGCPVGPNGQAMTIQANPPVIGQVFTVSFQNRPNPFVNVIMGVSREIGLGVVGLPSLPWDLTQVGMNGCYLLVSADLASAFVTDDWVIQIPNFADLAGLPLNIQGLSEAPGATPLGLITSNAGAGIVGF